MNFMEAFDITTPPPPTPQLCAEVFAIFLGESRWPEPSSQGLATPKGEEESAPQGFKPERFGVLGEGEGGVRRQTAEPSP